MENHIFVKLMRSVDKTTNYGRGYQHGLRKFYHGEKFLDDWAGADMSHPSRAELARGYHDGLAGKRPASRPAFSSLKQHEFYEKGLL